MQSMYRIFIWILVLIPLMACGKKEHAAYEGSGKEQGVEEARQDDGADKYVKEDRKLIREGVIRFESHDLKKTRESIDSAIAEFGGYISKENRYTHASRIEQNIVLRVPADNFDKMVKKITRQVGKIDSKNIELKDVTEEFFDTELRMRIKKETEKRYRELLTKANTVNDILSIESHIGNIRAEIESLEGKLKYLKNRISYGTLTINFYQAVSVPIGFGAKFKHGIENGWNNFVWFLVGLVNVWPFMVILIAAVPAARAERRKRKIARTASGEKRPDKQP